MASPMGKVNELLSSKIGNTLGNIKTWGSIIVNVKEYGAVGDGVTDDTNAIQRALSSLEEGYTLMFPEGIYLVNQLILSNVNNITITGNATIMGIGDLPYLFVINNCDRLKLLNIKFDGDGNKTLILDFGQCEEINIDSIIVTNVFLSNSAASSWCAGIRLRSGCSKGTLYNVIISNIIAESLKVSSGIVISSNSSESPSQDIVISGGKISNVQPGGDGDGIKLQAINQESNIIIENVSFDNCHKRAIKIQTNNVIVKDIMVNRNVPLGLSVVSAYGSNITVKGVRSYSKGTGSVTRAIDIMGGDNIVFEDFVHFNADDSFPSNVNDFIFISNGEGSAPIAANISIRNVHGRNVRQFLLIRNIPTENVEINNCLIENVRTNSIYIEGAGLTHKNLRIVNTKIVDPVNTTGAFFFNLQTINFEGLVLSYNNYMRAGSLINSVDWLLGNGNEALGNYRMGTRVDSLINGEAYISAKRGIVSTTATSIPANSSVDLSVTFNTNLSLSLMVSPVGGLPAGLIPIPIAQSANILVIRVFNSTGAAVSLPSKTWNVTVY